MFISKYDQFIFEKLNSDLDNINSIEDLKLKIFEINQINIDEGLFKTLISKAKMIGNMFFKKYNKEEIESDANQAISMMLEKGYSFYNIKSIVDDPEKYIDQIKKDFGEENILTTYIIKKDDDEYLYTQFKNTVGRLMKDKKLIDLATAIKPVALQAGKSAIKYGAQAYKYLTTE